jgi:hypothetical protein
MDEIRFRNLAFFACMFAAAINAILIFIVLPLGGSVQFTVPAVCIGLLAFLTTISIARQKRKP